MSKKTVTIINQEAVVDYLLGRRCKPLAAKLVEDLRYNIGIKGERFPEYVLAESVSNLIERKLFQEIECEVPQLMLAPEELYYIGVLPHNVTLNK